MAQAVRDRRTARLTPERDTIAALSSGRPPAAVAVIRVSGPAALPVGRALTSRALPPARYAGLRTLIDPATDEPLDHALMLVFPAPASATGEDVVEFHVHGGRAVGEAVLQAVMRQPHVRLAQAGEFTRRAFAHGRLDLMEAEGLADLLEAETEAQRRLALASAGGALSQQVDTWSGQLLALSGEIEAWIDFEDEGDVGARDLAVWRAKTGALSDGIQEALSRPAVERHRDGWSVVIAGPPNAGKSTLINALTQRELAIVSPAPGTTRDRIELTVVRQGRVFRFIDTAGLRVADDVVEAIGVERSHEEIARADLVLWIGDEPPEAYLTSLWVQPKGDLLGRAEPLAGQALVISAEADPGLVALWQHLESAYDQSIGDPGPYALNERQKHCLGHVRAALEQATSSDDPLVAAEELRRARGWIDALTGRSGTEEMLDALFGRFCIGK